MTLADPTEIVRSVDWHAHRYDPGGDQYHFIPADRAARARAVFLTGDYLQANETRAISRGVAFGAARGLERRNCLILHSAFCCSTLVANILEIPGVAMSLKEPVILNDLSGWRRRGASPRDIAERLDQSMAIMAASVPEDEALVIKPSNVVNALAPAMLGLRPRARALLLYTPIDTYLASIASKGMWGRLWVRDLWVKLAADGLCELGFEPSDHMKQTDLQIAALGWLAQHRLFGQIARRFPGQVRTCDSARLLGSPHAALSCLAEHFDLPLDADAIAGGPAFTTHAKSGAQFGKADRSALHDGARNAHRDEIAKVGAWAAAVAEANDIAMELPRPLI